MLSMGIICCDNCFRMMWIMNINMGNCFIDIIYDFNCYDEI